MELSADQLARVYTELLKKNEMKKNRNAERITQIIQIEKVSLKSKMREIIRVLINKSIVKFSELFSLKKNSKTEVVTGFLAVLELAKLKKILVSQEKAFSEIIIRSIGKMQK